MSEVPSGEISEMDSEPPVIGAGDGLPAMPTEAEHRAAWRAEFIRHCVAIDIMDEAAAADYFEAGADDWDYTETPADAIADDMEYWDDDGEDYPDGW